eukprot:TRINITY_DN18587_c0_g1_i1.p1 TRINITY_DN18587_c0_g1~~TRINITY_DN18587_c0_g1_i1.p1  ORF type:complete len:142 (-),score=15.66 TRINITY_DN18587_c0_g1_i1:73-498(-)
MFPCCVHLGPLHKEVHRDVLHEGDRTNYPGVGDTCVVHYTGYLAHTGSEFDSSLSRGKPFTFQIGVGQVIPGWDVGIKKMSLGEECRLEIPPKLGYGNEGAGNVVPPNADLIFDVQLLAINDKMAPTYRSHMGCYHSCSLM